MGVPSPKCQIRRRICEAPDHLRDTVADSWDRRDADRASEYFCLMWQIAEPVDPEMRWDELPIATRIRLIGPPPPKAILPVLGSIADLDREAGTRSTCQPWRCKRRCWYGCR